MQEDDREQGAPVAPPQAPRLFISHHSGEMDIALSVEAALEERGVTCWLAPRDVEPGEPFDEAIERAIAHTAAVLLLVSDRAADSRHVKRELIIADNHRKTIIPLRVEPVEPQKLTYHLADSQWIDWNDGDPAALDRVAARARQISGAPPSSLAPPSPRSSHRPIPSPSRSGTGIGAGALLVAALVGGAIGSGGTYFFVRDGTDPAAEVNAQANAAAPVSMPGYFLTPDRSSVTEGEEMRFIVVRSPNLPAATLNFSLMDDTDKPLDAGEVQLPGGGRPLMVPLEFQANQEIQQVVLQVRDDGNPDDGDRFYGALREARGDNAAGAIGQRSPIVTIFDRGG